MTRAPSPSSYYGFGGTYVPTQVLRSALSPFLLQDDVAAHLAPKPFRDILPLFPDELENGNGVLALLGPDATCERVATFLHCPAVLVTCLLCWAGGKDALTEKPSASKMLGLVRAREVTGHRVHIANLGARL